MRLRELWGLPLSDGTYLQMVGEVGPGGEIGRRFVELVPPNDSLLTVDDRECIRLGPLTAADRTWLLRAIDEAIG